MRKFIFISLLALVTSGVSLPAFADQDAGQSTMTVDDAKNQKNKVPGDESADDILTNNKLRAETGSTSRWSIATGFTYNGGTIDHPFGDFRPNIQNVNGQSPVTDIEGNVNVKYNMTQQDSLLLGETVRFITPLSSTTRTPDSYKGQKVDSYNPSLNYQRIYKAGPLQSYYQVGPTLVTQTDYSSIGYLGNFAIYNVNAYEIGKTHLTVGMESYAQYAWFRAPQAYPEFQMSMQDTEASSSDWVFFAYPYLEYSISDKLSLRTVAMWFQIEHTLAADSHTWVKDKAMQSVGLGISVTRDIFLYPNVQFVPDELRGKQTNVALSTNINIF